MIPTFRRSSLLVCGLLTAASAPAADRNGQLRGAIDGQSLDVPAHCERLDLPGWYKISTDPGHSFGDRNGDGIVVEFSGRKEDRVAVNAQLGDKTYTFGGSVQDYSGDGLHFVSDISRPDPATRKYVFAYRVDLQVRCPGALP